MSDLNLLDGLPGLRDYYPEDWQEINYILDKMREISIKYGYEEYEGPSIEAVELIEAKSGEGLMREIFQLTDRSDRKLLLRPEQTPTLAKMLAREQQRYKRPLRWFSIPRLFRDETVQKGRVREFWQLNVDMLGESSVVSDAELIAVGIDIVRACGIPDKEFKVYINHRSLLNDYIKTITDISPTIVIPIIDKKMSFYQDIVEKRLQKSGMDNQSAKDQALLLRRLSNSSGEFKESLKLQLKDTAKELLEQTDDLILESLTRALFEIGMENAEIEKLLKLVLVSDRPFKFLERIQDIDLPDDVKPHLNDLQELAKYLKSFDAIAPVVFDASMARGLDYYTGIVFEAFDSTGEVVRAIFGGGRYSDLIEAFGGTPLSGVGFGMGETVILELMKTRKIFDSIQVNKLDLYIAPIKKDPIPKVIELATRLRKSFNVISNPFKSWKKISKHFEFADEKNVKIVLLLGNRDIENNVVSVRIMKSSEQLTLTMDENLEAELRKLLN